MAKPKSFTVGNVHYNSIRELAAAYCLNYRTVANRISRSGQSPEEAVGLSIPEPGHKKPIVIRGSTYPSITAAAKHFGVAPYLVHGRLKREASPEDAVSKARLGKDRGISVEVGKQKFQSRKLAAQHFGLNESVVRYRYRKQWRINQIFGLEPPPSSNNRNAPKPIKFRNKLYRSHSDLAGAFGIDANKFSRRVKTGWAIEEALELNERSQRGKPKLLIIDGTTFKSRNEAARYYRIDIGTVATRVNKQNWTIKQALELEPRPKGSTTKFGFVYLIKNKLSGKYYVGITRKNYLKRFSEHVAVAAKQRELNPDALHAAIKEVGEDNFTIKVLAEPDTIGELQRLERKYIRELNTLAPNGYNLSTGGSMADLPGREVCIASLNLKFKSIAEAAHYFELDAGTVQHRLSKGYSDEQAVALEPLEWGSPDWHSTSIDGMEFANIELAAEYFGHPPNRIRNRIHKGWSVERALKTPLVNLSQEVVIAKKTYKSIRSASRDLGIPNDTLRERINSGRDPLTGK